MTTLRAYPRRTRVNRARLFGLREMTTRATPPAERTQRTLRVVLAGKLTGMTAPGGGERQLLVMRSALAAHNVEARLWRPWEDDISDVDCVHLFGSEPEHLPVATAAKRLGKPVVVSPIAWFDLASLWREPWPLAKRLHACAKFLARRAAPQLPSWRRRLYMAADMLLPNSQLEADQLVRHFGVSADRILVTPNGADERFADGRPEAFAELVGCEGFVLIAGRIEPRKNQLGVLRALRDANVDIVVLGDPLPEHANYHAACRDAAGPRTRFVSAIDHGSELLKSAYAACGCLALASWYETPGLVALEAAMSGAPLVLPKGGSACEYFGPHAEYVSPNDFVEIRAAVLRALAKQRSEALALHVRRNFTWNEAARATRRAYEKVL